MSRHRYLVCYDVRESKRLRLTHDTLLGYGEPLQYSVFACDLSASELVLMEMSLRDVISLTEDSVLIVDLGPLPGSAQRRTRLLGAGRLPQASRAVII